MQLNQGLIDLIKVALGSEPIPVSRLNQHTAGVLASLAKQGMEARSMNEGPHGAAVITNRSRPEFLILPIADTPEYLQATAEHASIRASEARLAEEPETLDARLDDAVRSAD